MAKSNLERPHHTWWSAHWGEWQMVCLRLLSWCPTRKKLLKVKMIEILNFLMCWEVSFLLASTLGRLTAESPQKATGVRFWMVMTITCFIWIGTLRRNEMRFALDS
jgi:hypothetical protein